MRRILFLILCALVFAHPAANGDVVTTNGARNPGFEEDPTAYEAIPAWCIFTTSANRIALVGTNAKSGSRAVRIATQGAGKKVQGLFQARPVSRGETYSFSISVRSDPADPFGGSACILMLIEWKDSDGQLMNKVVGKSLKAPLSRIRWEASCIPRAKVPDGAVEANFCIHYDEGDRGGRGSVLLDDVSILRIDHANK